MALSSACLQRSIRRAYQCTHVVAPTSPSSHPRPGVCQSSRRQAAALHARPLRRPFTSTTLRHQETHYDFFPTTIPRGPPPNGSFAIDLGALRKEFIKAQALAHPDRHPGEQKARAEALSSRINDAYKTLSDPLSRAQYILGLRGIDTGDETAKVEDQSLLMAVMEAQETIQEAEAETDLQEVKEENQARIDASVKMLEDAFERQDWDSAKTEAVKLRYWTNIKQGVDAWEPGKPVVLVH